MQWTSDNGVMTSPCTTVVGQEEISGRNYYRIRQTSELKELNGHEHLLREENRMVVYHLRDDVEFSNDVPLYDFLRNAGT